MALLGRVDAAIGVVPSLSGGVAARVAGMLRRRPVGLLVQDLMSAAAAQGGVPGSSGRVAGAVGAVERRIVRGARVATVARGFQAPLEAMGAAAVTYLPNFTTMPPGDNRPVAETRERLGIPHGAFVVGYSGNLGYKQDFETVIAAARLLHHDPSCLFLFVGEGSQRALIDASIQSGDIHGLRLPLQPSDQAFDLLRACDLLLAPQRATDLDMSVPSKLTAYLAAGRPVLAAASAHSETADQVRRSGGGSVIDPGDPVLLARTIQELRAEPSRLEVMGATGRRHAECEFTRQAAEVRFVEWAESLR
jgi:glycosyltransferase involved in cell wall biosynthesis